MKHEKLEKQLGLFDVYAISTGAMFSSGFFLLPGIASAYSGPSVIIAYLIGGILVLPAMLSVAELSTALPRAGGPYYFLDRSLGPMVGTVGGLGTWMALIFKSAFALVGMGAYLGLFFDVQIKPVAVTLTFLFMIMNIIGVKKTTRLQNSFVIILVGILLLFVVEGLFELFGIGMQQVASTQLTPFLPFGYEGLLATIGLVFVSYAGLTQIASVAEEVKNPDRNIPLGMILSLLTATVIYVLGVFVMVGVLDPDMLREDLTPVATAAVEFFDLFPEPTGLILIVIAAIAAFASTGNAGIMSAARYPLAMARDNLIWKKMSQVGKFKTPTISIIITSLLMVFFILVMNVEDIAKLASAFMLMIFGLLNLAVIVMRESKIEEYDPGFNSPLYPWLQLAGMLVSTFLIIEMGILPIAFTGLMTVACIGWYFYYAYAKVQRQGAIYHVHARLGERRYHGLETEMRDILREKGLREEDPYEKIVARSVVIDEKRGDLSYHTIIKQVSQQLAPRFHIEADALSELFIKAQDTGTVPLGRGVVINHLRIDRDRPTEMALVRIPESIKLKTEGYHPLNKNGQAEAEKICAILFIVSSENNSGQHLRTLAHLAEMVDNPSFIDRWNNARHEGELREVLLRDERFINITISMENKTRTLTGQKIKEVDLPGESLVAIIKRDGKITIPHGDTIIKEGDQLSIIGEKQDIEAIKEMIS
ncbi:amino acid permease [Halalkalibaculum sp. DA3122]|uniref:amino acid permease n=1 Tax=unclassified Halalkalibaculum TaxID=2964617 RepID=UPI0037551286